MCDHACPWYIFNHEFNDYSCISSKKTALPVCCAIFRIVHQYSFINVKSTHNVAAGRSENKMLFT